jgi:hypothetical protein
MGGMGQISGYIRHWFRPRSGLALHDGENVLPQKLSPTRRRNGDGYMQFVVAVNELVVMYRPGADALKTNSST